MDAVDVLLEARNRMTPETWHKGNYFDGNGGFCAMGHIYCAILEGEEWIKDNDEQDSPFIPISKDGFANEAINALSDVLAKDWDGIPNFNDHPNTTFEDVIDAFDTAIKNLKDHAGS